MTPILLAAQTSIPWEMVGVLGTLGSGLVGALVLMIKWLLDKYVAQIEAQFNGLKKDLAKHGGDMARLERDFLRYQKEAAERFVAREDWASMEFNILNKIDNLTRSLYRVKEGSNGH